MTSILYLMLGILLGGIIGWLAATRRAAVDPEQRRLEEELRNQAAAARQEAERERQSIASRDLELQTLREGAASSRADAAALRSQLDDLRARHQADLVYLRTSQEKSIAELRETFKALSADALIQAQPRFLELAGETLVKFGETAKGDLSQRQQSIAALVKPLEEQLRLYQERLQKAETAQSGALGELRRQLEVLAQNSQALSSETLELRQVLRSNHARGRWGEETLRRVVEASGLSSHCDFTEQTQMDDSKPDLLIHLPGGRVIIVDAKVPDLDLVAQSEQAGGEHRARGFAEHAAKLKQTVKSLSDRDYPARFPAALDFVVLFLPAESLFSAALEGDRDLMIWSQSKRILLATPTSLMAILRSVSLSWQQFDQTQNARQIALAAQELHGRVCKFLEHFERVRDGLEKATNAYNSAVGSYERLVRPSAERIKDLGAGVEGKEPPVINPLEVPLRSAPLAALPPSDPSASPAPASNAGEPEKGASSSLSV
ncbi:MAG: DNA recombination protein RmuC [Verrucomicrobia bacterium]|nr:DNA recombination protein RmuC [Verrucomicrobiota bacterium]